MEEKKPPRTDRYKSVSLYVVIAVLLGVFIVLQGRKVLFDAPSRALVAPGLTAPNFTLPLLDGKMVSLSDYQGKVVFLNIWATWCGPCREEMPSMQKLYKELQNEDFEILAVSIDILGARAVAPFMKELKLSFPALLNPEGNIKNLYNTIGVPETFIIDKKGIIVQKVIGPRDWASPEAVRYFRSLIQK